MQSTPPSRVALSQDYWMVAEYVNKKNAGKPRALAINARLHSNVALAATFIAVALIMMQSHRQSEFCANLNPTPASGVTPPWTFTWQNLTPAERVTRSGRPGYPPWWVTPPIM